MEKLTLSIREAAEMLGVPVNTMYTHAQAGRIPTLRLGKRILIPRVALERMVQAACEPPGPEFGWAPRQDTA